MPHIPASLTTEKAREIEYRFWTKIQKGADNECWPWRSSITRGYGMITAWGRPQYAHRIAYALGRGDIGLGQQVLHECDNTVCCNPKHLFLGSQLDNMRDRNAKGRANWARGEDAGRAKLTNAQALDIYNAKGTFREIADKFGCNPGTVFKIKMGRAWRSVTGGEPQPTYHKRNVA